MPPSSDVDAWLRAYDNPMKPVVQRLREILLGADPRITECIKWKTPTLVFEGNLASFNPRAKRFASLLFHTGAEIPGTWPHLQGEGDVARYLNVATVEEAESLRSELEAIVRAWIALRSKGTARPAPRGRGRGAGA